MKCHDFTCHHCGNTYHTQTSTEDMETEYRDNFPTYKNDERVCVCDDCYLMFMEWYKTQGGSGTEAAGR